MSTTLFKTGVGAVWTRAAALHPLHPLHLLLSLHLWKSLLFVLLDLPAGLLYFLVLISLLSIGVGTLPVGIGFILLALVPPLTRLGARIERQRACWLLDDVIPAPASTQALASDAAMARHRSTNT